ncbi:MAG: hypothetical protein LBQ86_08305 [Holophagales bacterium]|nr:hypothetical protein [Holophagales bacterium]
MGVPVIKLNLAPPPTLWRLHHGIISWIVFVIGVAGLGISIVATVRAYQEADRAGQKTVAITDQARAAQRQQANVLDELREISVDNEMPRWRLAERILMERALPWSRVTAELERSLVHDVRIKSLQRARGADQSVQIKLRGESRTEEAEADFIKSLHENLAFAQVVLERESEITNRRGALEFDYNLHLSTEPPPYELLPKYGPERKPGQTTTVSEPPPKPEVKPEPQAEPAAPTAPQVVPQPPQPQFPQERDALRERVRPERRAPAPRQLGRGLRREQQ